MGKYFGTDGIRGIANESLDARLAYLTGLAAATVLRGESDERPLAVIGKDTRISSDMLEAALIAGLCSGGADAMPIGVVPTPAVAFAAKRLGATLAIVISASHNPYEHNGIKIFNSDGFKLSDEHEAEIERMIDTPDIMGAATHGELGRIVRDSDSTQAYIEKLAAAADGDLSSLKIIADCANGAASSTARRLFEKLGVQATTINDTPDGVNINTDCGSTHIEGLRRAVVDGGFDVGFAFDGDADRCLMVDERGEIIDGDVILAVSARYLKEKGQLACNTVVGTIISNSGLLEFGRREGIEVLMADVGDRNVLEMMRNVGSNLGGEASGHTIYLDDSTTGDGQLAAVKFMSMLARRGVRASEFVADVPKFPQVMLNTGVANEEKKRIMESAELAAAVAEVEQKIAGSGRILVRPSGTEALVRVTVEAETEAKAHEYARQVTRIIESL